MADFQGQWISDANMDWMRKRIWITPVEMGAILDDGTSGVPQSSISGVGVTQGEASTFGPIGYVMTDGEFLTGAIPLPWDLDPAYEIGFNIVYFADANGACTTDWILQYAIIDLAEAYAAPGVALDTPIALTDAYGSTDWVHRVTARGIALAATHAITKTQIEAPSMIMLEVEMDAATNETAIHYYGLLMDYAVQRCPGTGRGSDQSIDRN
jgi:hypothetical protein